MTQTRAKTRAERQAELIAQQLPDAPEPREPTATERMAALAERRHAGGGYLIAPPEPLTFKAFRAWLHAVAELGTPGDVEIAWHFCNSAPIKGQLLNEYEALKDQAGRRHHAVQTAAWAEQQAEQAAAAKRAARGDIEREIAEHETAIAALRKRLVALEI